MTRVAWGQADFALAKNCCYTCSGSHLIVTAFLCCNYPLGKYTSLLLAWMFSCVQGIFFFFHIVTGDTVQMRHSFSIRNVEQNHSLRITNRQGLVMSSA